MMIEAPAPTGNLGSEWRLVGVVQQSGAFPNLQFVDGVSAEDAQRLHGAMVGLRDFESRYYVSLVWRANFEEFTKYWRLVHVESGQDRGFSGRVGTRVSLELKRLILNYLSSSVSLIEHLKGADSKEMTKRS